MVRSLETPAADAWRPDTDFGGRAVHVLEYDRPASGADDELTQQAIDLMNRLADRDSHSPAIRAQFLGATRGIAGSAGAKEIADAIFAQVQRTVHYRHEADMNTPFTDFREYLYDQTLIAPAALVSMPRPEGDCVDFSMLTASMLDLCRIPRAFKTIAADPDSAAFSHVYVIAQIGPGRFYALDTSNGPGPGYEFELPRGKKSKLWPNPFDLKRGAPVLHKRRAPASRLQRGRRGLRGLGDLTCDESGCYDDSPTYDPTTDTPLPNNISGPIIPGYTYTPTPTSTLCTSASCQMYGAPLPSSSAASGNSNSTSAWTKISTAIINDASAIAAPLIRQSTAQAPYYIAGKNGAQVLYDPSTGKTVNAGSGGGLTAAGGSPNLLLYAGLAAVLLIAVEGSQGHR